MLEYGHNTRVAVIGAGSWGTALANLLAAKGYDVMLWVRTKYLAQRLACERENRLYLPHVPLHPRLTSTADFAEAAHAATAHRVVCHDFGSRSLGGSLYARVGTIRGVGRRRRQEDQANHQLPADLPAA